MPPGILVGPISSLERYRRTLLFQQQGVSRRTYGNLQRVHAVHISAGNPIADVISGPRHFRAGHWRLKPISLSLGLRYEHNQYHDWTTLLHGRLAYAPGAKAQTGKTVIRVGSECFTTDFRKPHISTIRQNGILQQQYTVFNPDFIRIPPQLRSGIKKQARPFES